MRHCVLILSFLVLQACKHPLAIEGEGDIVDLNGGAFGCTLEQYLASDPACTDNEVTGDYFVNYTAIPRAGWRFDHWEGSCGHLSEGPNCRFDVSAAIVDYWDATYGEVLIPPLTAVFVENLAPIADSGSDQIVDEESIITLDGSNSSDLDGSVVSYTWSQLSGTGVVVSEPNLVSTDFTAPTLTLAEVLVFELTVTDDLGATAADTVSITVNPVNSTPIADAGIDQEVDEHAVVTLDGSASRDDDGVLVAYLWTQTDGINVIFSDREEVSPTFTSPTLTSLTVFEFVLEVKDNEGDTSSDAVTIAIHPLNIPPIANSGANQSVIANTGVSLDGSKSSDADGSIESFLWSQTSGTPVDLSDPSISRPSFTAGNVTTAESLSFALVVTDNEGGVSAPQEVVVIVNPADAENLVPVADAGADQTVLEASEVSLTALASADLDGSISEYAWLQTSGTAVSLSNAASSTPVFTSPVLALAETLTFEVTVTDDDDASATDTVAIVVEPANLSPLSTAGADQQLIQESVVLLDGSGSSDPDGQIESFLWRQLDGVPVSLADNDSAISSFTAPTVGGNTPLVFELLVIDNEGNQGVDTVIITVLPTNMLPVANAGGDQEVIEETPVALDGSSSADDDGLIAGYQWAQLSGSFVTLSDAGVASPTFTAPVVTTPEVLSFQLTVTDDRGATGSDVIQVLILPVNAEPIADAGPDQLVNEQTQVDLDGRSSGDADGNIESYFWTQTAGTEVTLTDAETAQPGFVAPSISSTETLTFELTVTDNEGETSQDTVEILLFDLPDQMIWGAEKWGDAYWN